LSLSLNWAALPKAGEILGRSQPAVSLQIQRLEELVDESLLARNGKSLELTDAGQNLYTYA
jgi:DNA-binding transcriptional LysR family regulator